MRFEQIRKPLLMSCLAASVALHLGVFYYFYHHPVTMEKVELATPIKSEAMPLIQEELLIGKIEDALEQSLNQLAALPKPVEETNIATRPTLKDEDFGFLNMNGEFTSLPPLFDPEKSASLADYALEDELESRPFEYQTEKYASLDLIEPLINTGLPSTILEPQVLEEDQEIPELNLSPTLINNKFTVEMATKSDLKKLKTPADLDLASDKAPFVKIQESTIPRLIIPNSVDYLREQWLERTLADRTLPSVEHYGIEELTGSVDWDTDIAADVSYMQDPESNRYIFSVTLQPESDINTEKLNSHFYFIIDRTHAVEKQKMARYNRAVARALSALNEGDTFNIILFDKRIEKFSEKDLAAHTKNIQRAEEFLENQQKKSHLKGELFTSLDALLPKEINTDEIYSVIFISDGNAILKDSKDKRVIGEWFKTNFGNINFYTATSGKDNNLALLDVLSYGTAGKLLYSDTNAGFPRKLVRLVKDLHEPIVKNVTVDVIARDAGAKIALSGTGKNPLPPMFAGKPYTLIGTIDELCDFTLLIQGKCGDRYLNIKKEISLKEAGKGGRALVKAWANSKANVCYERFLETGKNIHLKEAKELVSLYEGTIAAD